MKKVPIYKDGNPENGPDEAVGSITLTDTFAEKVFMASRLTGARLHCAANKETRELVYVWIDCESL